MPVKARKVPMRMCVVCRTMKEKRELIRIVRGTDGTIAVDRKGKAPGRGAYVCLDRLCVERAQKTRQLERVFETRIPDGIYASLLEEISAGP